MLDQAVKLGPPGFSHDPACVFDASGIRIAMNRRVYRWLDITLAPTQRFDLGLVFILDFLERSDNLHSDVFPHFIYDVVRCRTNEPRNASIFSECRLDGVHVH